MEDSLDVHQAFQAPRNDLEWEAFFTEYNDFICQIVAWRKWSFPRHVQEDIAQQARTALFKALPTFKGQSSLRYFIKRIVMNKCLDELRKTIRHKGVIKDLAGVDDEHPESDLEQFPADQAAPFDCLLRQERIRHTKAFLTKLDETCLTVIRGYYHEGHTYKELAEELGLTVNTIGSRLSKCLTKLEKMISEHAFFEEYFAHLRDT